MSLASVKHQKVLKVPGNGAETPDLVVVEEPLEIRILHGPANDRKKSTLSVTMRTPGHDFELAAGFLFTEGVISHADDIKVVRHCEDVDQPEALHNIVIVELQESTVFDEEKLKRNFYMTSSCGVCGKASIEAIENQNCPVLLLNKGAVSTEVLHGLSDTLREHQKNFAYTGGIHAAAAFNSSGELLLSREDVGRHNALDKLVGAQLLEKTLLNDSNILMLSGRLSFELIQKAVMGGFPIVAAVGAPSSLAIETAKSFNQTVIGFLRDHRFNIYSVPERISNTTT